MTLLVLGCTTTIEEVIPDNEPFSSNSISKIKIENYVNRLFIDILSREPTDLEQERYVDSLIVNNLSREGRLRVISELMTDTSFSVNEGSFREAYVQNLYNLAKIRCLEGQSDAAIRSSLGIVRSGALRDSLNGNWDDYYEKLNSIRRFELTLASRVALLEGEIEFHEMFAFMINNPTYDVINMNAFNFIRATFDQLLFRLPTGQEYDEAFKMVELEEEATLFGKTGISKEDYVEIVTQSDAMLEGMIRWSYQVFLNREPSAAESATLFLDYLEHQNINLVLEKIFVTDEYANFP